MNLVTSKNSAAKYSAGRIDNDWSARHVRLRFEMLISAVVFYLVSLHGIGVVNLPFIKLPKNFDQNTFICLALGFAVFALISFVVRSEYERALWPKQELLKHHEITQFSNDFKNIKNEFFQLIIEEEGVNNFLVKFHKKQNEIRQNNYSISVFQQLLSDLHEENGVNSPVHPKFWSKMVLDFERIRKISDDLYSLSNLLELKNDKFSIYMRNLSSVPDDVRKYQDRIKINFKNISPQMNERVSYLYKYSKIKWFQTQFLSVVVPVLTASVFIFLGSYKLLNCAN